MKKISFYKYSGAGNDFILIDGHENSNFKINTEEIVNLCTRRTGIGSDGILHIQETEGYDYRLDFYNPDGSTGMLCANGARCSIAHASAKGWIDSKNVRFIANKREYSGVVLNKNLVRLNLLDPEGLELNKSVQIEGGYLSLHQINTGSPHVVVFLEELQKLGGSDYNDINSLVQIPVSTMGAEIRSLKDFLPEGVNVNFVHVSGDTVLVRTFEKGVEAETLASGTGSTASALISHVVKGLEPPIRVSTFGGDYMEINFKKNDNVISDVSLTGPAKEIFKGEYII
ncbi:MAG: diaminopimelate epimerase [Bacteroidetes bacterium]|nr:diaminopimelate epimerase [Bacteroidota bacterium]